MYSVQWKNGSFVSHESKRAFHAMRLPMKKILFPLFYFHPAPILFPDFRPPHSCDRAETSGMSEQSPNGTVTLVPLSHRLTHLSALRKTGQPASHELRSVCGSVESPTVDV